MGVRGRECMEGCVVLEGAKEAPASFIKLAMRNMVRKGRQSLFHFGLTALGLTGFLVLIAWLGRPSLPQ